MDAAARYIDWIPPQALVVISRALQALAAPVVALLVVTAESISTEVQDAVSYCNVLFVGNLCAGLLVMAMFGPRKISTSLQQLTPATWVKILGFAALAALLSALIFTALMHTMVTNAVLLARLGPVLFVIGSAIFIGQALLRSEWLGFGLIAFAVLAVVFVDNDFAVNKGDLLILASAVVYAIVTMLSKHLLPQTGMPALIFARNFFSAIIFFIAAIILFGFDHFMHAFYGPLWGIMLVYALVIVIIGQATWYSGISRLTPASVARWTVMTPALAVGYAYLINGEVPSQVQLLALVLILAGIVISNVGKHTPRGSSDSVECSVAAS
jgi:drug/metabolite transporter (DMT)-like permease